MDPIIGSIAVPVITAAVFTVIAILRGFIRGEWFSKITPLVAAAIGIGLAIGMYYLAPSGANFTDSLYLAIIIGAVSGLAATGTHQAMKQITRPKNDPDNLL